MKIISVRQPWASLIVTGGMNVQNRAIELKDVENRTWSTHYRRPFSSTLLSDMTT